MRLISYAVVALTARTIVSTGRFLSSEGLAECEKACNKEKPSLQEMSKAALNVSILNDFVRTVYSNLSLF